MGPGRGALDGINIHQASVTCLMQGPGVKPALSAVLTAESRDGN